MKLKRKGFTATPGSVRREREMSDPLAQQQHKNYEEAMRQFHEQKFHKAKQAFEKVLEGPSRELNDRAQVHMRVCERRISKLAETNPRTSEEHYHHGVAMMNLGRWEESRQALERARKLAPKADFVFYALAALDSLTGEAESAMTHLKAAIELRPENRYHARNDEDFAYLLEDPRFTELLYPERDGSPS
jgi:tetratricopeptide (TPR) repeat protein